MESNKVLRYHSQCDEVVLLLILQVDAADQDALQDQLLLSALLEVAREVDRH